MWYVLRMDAHEHTPGPVPRTRAVDAVAVVGLVVAALLALYLAWWLPARVSSGYVVPTMEGSTTTLPRSLPVIWVRAWPWQTEPPGARVTFVLSGGRRVSVAARATARPAFYARAVPAELDLTRAPAMSAGEVLAIDVRWNGGATNASESDLWISASTGAARARDATPVWSPHVAAGARLGVELGLGANPDVVALSSPAPSGSPWLPARCLAAGHGTAADLLRGRVQGGLAACGGEKAGTVVAVTGPLPAGYEFFVWQPTLQELVQSHMQTLVVGPPLVMTSAAITSANWWRFAAGSPPPGF